MLSSKGVFLASRCARRVLSSTALLTHDDADFSVRTHTGSPRRSLCTPCTAPATGEGVSPEEALERPKDGTQATVKRECSLKAAPVPRVTRSCVVSRPRALPSLPRTNRQVPFWTGGEGGETTRGCPNCPLTRQADTRSSIHQNMSLCPSPPRAGWGVASLGAAPSSPVCVCLSSVCQGGSHCPPLSSPPIPFSLRFTFILTDTHQCRIIFLSTGLIY